MHNFNYGFIYFQILLIHISFKPIWCTPDLKIYEIKKKIYNQKRNHTNTNISNGELIAIKSSSIIMNICFSYVEEYACVVTCVPYYMNCNVSENVNFKNIYISSEICSKHTDSIYRIYIYKNI